MKNTVQCLIIAALLLLAPLLSAAATPPGGSDGSVEWKQVNSFPVPASARDFVYSLDGRYAFILTEDQRVLVYDARGSLLGSIPVDSGVSAIDLAPQGQLLYLIDTEKNITSTLAIDFIVTIDVASSAFKGADDAPVTIVVFSDFQ
jgi:protein-disulfide isomerase